MYLILLLSFYFFTYEVYARHMTCFLSSGSYSERCFEDIMNTSVRLMKRIHDKSLPQLCGFVYINKSDQPVTMHQMTINNYTDLHNMTFIAFFFLVTPQFTLLKLPFAISNLVSFSIFYGVWNDVALPRGIVFFALVPMNPFYLYFTFVPRLSKQMTTSVK